MKHNIFRIAALILSLAIMLTLCGCGEKGEVNDLVEDFEQACQELDVDDMVDCISPNITGSVQSVMNLLGMGDMRDSVSEIFELIGMDELLEDVTDATQDLDLYIPSLQIKPTAYSFNKERTKCDVSIDLSCEVLGKPVQGTFVLKCVLVDDDWYINGFSR